MRKFCFLIVLMSLLAACGTGNPDEVTITIANSRPASNTRQGRATATMTTTPTGTPLPTMTRPATQIALIPTVVPATTTHSDQTSADTIAPQRIVLYSANMNILADNPTAVVDEITYLVTGMGGWLVQSNTNSVPRYNYTQITVNVQWRIPAAQLQSIMDTLKDYAVNVISEQITGDDVTADFVDTNSRLNNLLRTEEQLQQLMTDAENVEEVLTVLNQLTNIRGQIETAQGRINYFTEASSYSLLRLTISAPTSPPTPTYTPTPTDTPTPESVWNPLDAAAIAVEDATLTWQGWIDDAVRFLVNITLLSPVLIAGAVLLWFVLRFVRRR